MRTLDGKQEFVSDDPRGEQWPATRTPQRWTGLPARWRGTGFAAVAWGVFILSPLLARAQIIEDAAVDLVPPVSEASLEGVVIEEQDAPIDALGNTRIDLVPGARDAEPLDPELEKRLDELSALREAMAEGVAEFSEPLIVPALNDRSAPPRMDERGDNPDRIVGATDAADEPAPIVSPEGPSADKVPAAQ